MNANDQLRDYNCSEEFYKYNFGLVISEGVKAMAEKFGVYWWLDIIASYQSKLKAEEFQVWTLGRNEDTSAIVICTDGNNKILASQEIGWTDFSATEATIWVEFGTAILPSEH